LGRTVHVANLTFLIGKGHINHLQDHMVLFFILKIHRMLRVRFMSDSGPPHTSSRDEDIAETLSTPKKALGRIDLLPRGQTSGGEELKCVIQLL
jgi:hypothetical protein